MIRFHGVWKRYGRTVAVADLSFAVGEGELVLLRGPNGSGKSTCLRLAAGVAMPDRGRVERATGVRVGYLGHRSQLLEGLTVRENLLHQAELYRIPWRRLAEAVERFGVDAWWRRPVRALSRGMLQRVLLARVAALAPELLLLDEPETGLDETACAGLLAFVSEARAQGTTILVASHTQVFAGLEPTRTLRFAAGRLA